MFSVFRKIRFRDKFREPCIFHCVSTEKRTHLSFTKKSSTSFHLYPMNSGACRLSHRTSVKKNLAKLDSKQSISLKNLELLKEFDKGVLLDNLDQNELEIISKRFGFQGLDVRHMYKYNVKISSDNCFLMFPFDGLDREIEAIQYLHYKKDIVGERLENHFSVKLSNVVLFGWSLVGTNAKEIVITSDPLDAIAVNQETDVLAIAVPHDFVAFPPDVLKSLRSFKKVILWLKPHQHNWKLHKLFSSTLEKAAYFIRPNEKFNGALANLQNECNLKQMLRETYSLVDQDIETFELYRDAIYNELRGHERYSGLKWKRFGILNEILKGHRKGELTVFSGQTGTGKTTFMSEYSLDLCMQGLPTLWGSFEIVNTRLMKTMLKQFSRCSFTDNLDEFEHWFEQFLEIPMFFMNFHGQRSIKRVIQAMTHSVIVYNIQHIVIDNLQFMMNMEDYNSTIDQLRRQDQIFSAFREFASQHNCHITLVMHPRKEPEFTELSNTSISGTAKATQEADNILILQTTKSRQYLQISLVLDLVVKHMRLKDQGKRWCGEMNRKSIKEFLLSMEFFRKVTKNRFDGQKGCVVVEFSKESQTFELKKIGKNFNNIERPEVKL